MTPSGEFFVLVLLRGCGVVGASMSVAEGRFAPLRTQGGRQPHQKCVPCHVCIRLCNLSSVLKVLSTYLHRLA